MEFPAAGVSNQVAGLFQREGEEIDLGVAATLFQREGEERAGDMYHRIKFSAKLAYKTQGSRFLDSKNLLSKLINQLNLSLSY